MARLDEMTWAIRHYGESIQTFIQTKPEPPKDSFANQPVADAAELLARWLWLQLPDESKKDLMP